MHVCFVYVFVCLIAIACGHVTPVAYDHVTPDACSHVTSVATVLFTWSCDFYVVML